ncbi:succinyl-diaminopimelate desuccinylase [Sphingomonas sp. CFBP 13728]|uniref:succinyl-diaminopimelate desuccinylase n=1 Tax=Sphingomonas sp. CFBP 13728 TaxID=2775294 RepID=UPI0017840B8B|nr:succinyl-diaminopimelate desuccinylase [Sphingomonas sp. CFBP 13728]MBD8618143.1 succinyl-diaminopimelate desuccinylase [Sphingomonas sp. CFBP 13728]
MSAPIDPVALTQALLRADSVTPARGTVFDILESALAPLGFAVDRFVVGEAPDGPVENLLAVCGDGPRHLAFAGHVDVVPPGEGWTGSPWSGEVRDGLLYGRGAVDMKGAVAAFVAAASRSDAGTLSLIITGDEEGPATYGTVALMERMAARGIVPDLCLVGEPTSTARLGDMMKIGRRGSVNIWIDVPGRQGHVAYPHLADNPIPRLIAILAEIETVVLDEGTDWFQPSNIEVTDIAVGNPAHNVIPAKASARLSVRFNDQHRGTDLIEHIRAIAERHAPGAVVKGKVSGEAFLTEPGAFSTLLSAAIVGATGVTPELSTTGGTSDARFLSKLCPVVEFGLINATMHKVDEAVAVADLLTLTDIYEDVIARALG